MDEHEDKPDAMPREFWSEYTDRPFEKCIDCDGSLFDGEWDGYAIQKSVVAGETVFEMAICAACAAKMQSEFSAESLRALAEFVQNAPERLRRLAEQDEEIDAEDAAIESVVNRFFQRGEDIEERSLTHCGACGKPRDECHRYSIGTACLGSGILISEANTQSFGSPFLICDDCQTALNECVSKKTRDAWDRFIDRNFDGPPEVSIDSPQFAPVF